MSASRPGWPEADWQKATHPGHRPPLHRRPGSGLPRARWVAHARRAPRRSVICPYANSVVEFQLRRSIGTQRQVARSISFGRNRQHLRTHRAAQGGADRDAAPPVVRAAGSGASRRRRRAAHPSAHGCMRWRRPGRPFQHSRTNGCRLRSPTCFSLPKGSGRLRPKRLCDKSGGW